MRGIQSQWSEPALDSIKYTGRAFAEDERGAIYLISADIDTRESGAIMIGVCVPPHHCWGVVRLSASRGVRTNAHQFS